VKKRRRIKPLPTFDAISTKLYIDPPVERMFELVRRLERQIRHPVSTALLVTRTGWSERTIRYYLAQAERARLVYRPLGRCSGWSIHPPQTTGIVQLSLLEWGRGRRGGEVVSDAGGAGGIRGKGSAA
jgi:hypothetical protein